MKSVYTTLLCLCIAFTSVAQTKSKCELLGHVLDEKGEHLPYVTIYVKETGKGTSTDSHGHFTLAGLPEGLVTIRLSFIGYETLEQQINLLSGKTNEMEFILKEKSLELNEIVVSANRHETSRKETPVIVSVLNPKLFDVTASNSLSEGLAFLPGLRVENTCQNCGTQQVRINGLDGQYSQLLIDSRPIVSALTGVYGLEQIPAGMIDRVEVIRGGGSALYGSNAIGGIINIITKEPVRNTGSLSHNITMIGGKAAENRTSLNASLVTEGHSAGIFFFGDIKHRNAYDNNGDSFSEIAKIEGRTLGFRGYYKPTTSSKLTLEYHNIGEYRRGGNLFHLPPHEADICEQADHNINGGGFKYDIFSLANRQKVSIYGATQHTKRRTFYGGNNYDEIIPEYGGYGYTTDLTLDAGTQYSYSFGNLWFMPAQLVLGAEFNYDNLRDVTPAYDRNIAQVVRIGSFFFQNEWKNERFSFLLGARLDKHNMIDNPIFSPRINIRYSPTENIGLRATYSTGFLAPQTFSEDLHVEASGGTLVLIKLAPDLEPEFSQTVGLSADLYRTFGSVQTNFLAEGFYTDMRDLFMNQLIGTDSEGNIIREKHNAYGAYILGVNLEAKAVFNKNYQCQAGFTFQRGRYKEPESWAVGELTEKILRSPNAYGYFTAQFTPVSPLAISLSGVYTGTMDVEHILDDNDSEIVSTPDFFDANIKCAYTLKLKGNLKMELSAGMKNIFNSYQSDFDKGSKRDAAYVYGPIYPRSYFAGIKIVF